MHANVNAVVHNLGTLDAFCNTKRCRQKWHKYSLVCFMMCCYKLQVKAKVVDLFVGLDNNAVIISNFV